MVLPNDNLVMLNARATVLTYFSTACKLFFGAPGVFSITISFSRRPWVPELNADAYLCRVWKHTMQLSGLCYLCKNTASVCENAELHEVHLRGSSAPTTTASKTRSEAEFLQRHHSLPELIFVLKGAGNMMSTGGVPIDLNFDSVQELIHTASCFRGAVTAGGVGGLCTQQGRGQCPDFGRRPGTAAQHSRGMQSSVCKQPQISVFRQFTKNNLCSISDTL